MFDPKNFTTSPKQTVIGNSAHPIAQHAPLTMKKVPMKGWGVEYVVAHDDTWCATWDDEHQTLGVYDYGLAELKRRVKLGEHLGEVVDVDMDKNKYLGNLLIQELTIMKLID